MPLRWSITISESVLPSQCVHSNCLENWEWDTVHKNITMHSIAWARRDLVEWKESNRINHNDWHRSKVDAICEGLSGTGAFRRHLVVLIHIQMKWTEPEFIECNAVRNKESRDDSKPVVILIVYWIRNQKVPTISHAPSLSHACFSYSYVFFVSVSFFVVECTNGARCAHC